MIENDFPQTYPDLAYAFSGVDCSLFFNSFKTLMHACAKLRKQVYTRQYVTNYYRIGDRGRDLSNALLNIVLIYISKYIKSFREIVLQSDKV